MPKRPLVRVLVLAMLAVGTLGWVGSAAAAWTLTLRRGGSVTGDIVAEDELVVTVVISDGNVVHIQSTEIVAREPVDVPVVERAEEFDAADVAAYRLRRLTLHGPDGRRIGPSDLGFPGGDLGLDVDDAYTVRGATWGDRPIAPRALTDLIAPYAPDRGKHEFRYQDATAKRRVAGIFAVAGAMAWVIGAPIAAAGAQSGNVDAGIAGGVVLGTGVYFTIGGLVGVANQGRRINASLRGDPSLKDGRNRKEMWRFLRAYNADLCVEMGLTDCERLDRHEAEGASD